jgi:hypothetical protein
MYRCAMLCILLMGFFSRHLCFGADRHEMPLVHTCTHQRLKKKKLDTSGNRSIKSLSLMRQVELSKIHHFYQVMTSLVSRDYTTDRLTPIQRVVTIFIWFY